MTSPVASLRPGDLLRIRAERWSVTRVSVHENVSSVEVRGAEAANRGVAARFLLPFEPVERLAMSSVPRVVRPAEWRGFARSVLGAATPRVDALRTAAQARFDVMPYQLEPALAVTRGLGCRLLIADEVGLGKTVQAGLIVAELMHRLPDGRALVVCPASLRGQWQQELGERFGLEAASLDSATLSRTMADFDSVANPWAATPVAIASIDFIKRPEVLRALEGLVWDVLVLDEAHNLATRSDRARAAAALAGRVRTIVMLSATPHSGDEAAFARLCGLGDTHGRFPLLFFRRTRADVGIAGSRRMRWLRVPPTAAERGMHDALARYATRVWGDRVATDSARLAVSVLLRRAASSATSLARSVERRLEAIGTSAQTTAAQLELPFGGSDTDEEPYGILEVPALADREEEQHYLDRILSLARLAAARESKVATLLRCLARVHEPVLVFTEYRDTLMRLRAALTGGTRRESDVVELHGGLTPRERDAAERAFTRGLASVLLATDAASEGLNLHYRCRFVINLETPWSPVRLEQRIGRVDRIGQRRRVHALNLVAAGTLDEAIVRRVRERGRRAAGALRAADPTDLEVGTEALTGIDMAATAPPAALPPALLRPDLRSLASAEAARIDVARRMQQKHVRSSQRPIVTATARTTRRSTLVFEIALTDEDDMPVWQAIVGVAGESRATVHRCHDVRRAIEILAGGLDRADWASGLLHADAETWRAIVEMQIAREQAIAALVRLRHARIAADLLQPGLFDRRAERRAASQSAVLEEALGRCGARLHMLGRSAQVTAARPVLRFAVLLP